MATQRPWIFVQNPILNATDGSYRLADRISTYHIGALQHHAGVAFFDALIATYAPLHESFITAFNEWKTQGGLQKGETLNIAQLMKLLSGTKARQWDVAVQNVYPQGTSDYVKLFPNFRTPFQQGTQTDREAAVAALNQAIGSDAALATVKTDVLAFYLQLKAALSVQKGSISGTKGDSAAVEAARVAMCTGQYANLGALIQHFAATPDNINQYFDLQGIRNGQQVLFTGDTNPQQAETIMQHTFGTNDMLLLQNEGSTELRFYLAAQKNDAPSTSTVIVAAGSEQLVPITSLGSIALTFVNVYNPDTINKGEWTVQLQ